MISHFLSQISQHFPLFVLIFFVLAVLSFAVWDKAVQCIAVLDVLMSLAYFRYVCMYVICTIVETFLQVAGAA